jgi:hypothetical protein
MAKPKKNDKRLYLAILILASIGLGLYISDYLSGNSSWQVVVGLLFNIALIVSGVYLLLAYKQK